MADAALYLKHHKPELGIQDPYALDRKQFDAALALLREQRKIVGRYWHDAFIQVDDFVNEGVVAGSSWPFQVNLLRSKKAPVASVIPEEGATGWADTTMMHVERAASQLRVQLAGALALAAGRRETSRPGSARCPPSFGLRGQRAPRREGVRDERRGELRPHRLLADPVAACGGGRECVPYHEWVTSYIAVIGGR